MHATADAPPIPKSCEAYDTSRAANLYELQSPQQLPRSAANPYGLQSPQQLPCTAGHAFAKHPPRLNPSGTLVEIRVPSALRLLLLRLLRMRLGEAAPHGADVTKRCW